MRHRVLKNHLGRNTKVARALYRSLLTAVLDHGRIQTSLAKAKAIQADLDKVISLAKKDTVAARRRAIQIFGSPYLLDKIFTEVAPKYPNRNSGYSRIIKLGQRLSDTTEMVILELVEGVEKTVEPAKQIGPIKTK